ncbi:HAD family hydrolase [Streptomyces venezuelae]|uniref:HAD family hydrolase n=1 Tax=Streptomyces venezuelae TaxID=54571 RepID=UPI00379D723D
MGPPSSAQEFGRGRGEATSVARAESDAHPSTPATRLRDVRAVVFDTDGVITDSARVHAAAWKTAFDAYLCNLTSDDPARRRPFDANDDYLRYVDGKSRLDGAKAFLASRGLDRSAQTVRDIAEEKERLFVRRLREHGIDAYPGTVRLLHALRLAGTPLAAASASRHACEILTRAGVAGLFDVLLDGGEAARLGLPGKPQPHLFLEAARRLGVPARHTAVVEDALAGVEAGRRGGFALVVGVDRGGTADSYARLLRHGADLVVRDLGELLLGGRPT